MNVNPEKYTYCKIAVTGTELLKDRMRIALTLSRMLNVKAAPIPRMKYSDSPWKASTEFKPSICMRMGGFTIKIMPAKLMKIEPIISLLRLSPSSTLDIMIVQIGDVKKIAYASLRLSMLIA